MTKSITKDGPVDEMKLLAQKLSTLGRKEIKDYLSLLDRESKLAHRSGVKPSQVMARDEAMWVTSLLETLAVATTGSRSHSRPSDSVLTQLQDSYAPVALFMKSAGLYRDKSYERKAVYEFLANLLVSYASTLAHKVGVPLGPRFVLQNLDKLPGIFDASFPGYCEAGLAWMVVGKLLQQKEGVSA